VAVADQGEDEQSLNEEEDDDSYRERDVPDRIGLLGDVTFLVIDEVLRRIRRACG